MLRNIVITLSIIIPICLSVPAHAQETSFKLKTVVIDAGHGGKDPGALIGPVREKDIVLEVALKTGELIIQKHPEVNVVFTRSDDTFVPLADRADIANKSKADLFISIHVNYFSSGTVYGAETYIMGNHRSEENLKVAQMENSVILLEEDYSTKYEGFNPNSAESYIMFELIQNEFLEQSRFFADQLQKSFINHAKRKNRGVRQAGFLVLRRTTMPSVLVELGFISNLNERSYLISKDGKTRMAQSIANAFSDYKHRVDSRSNLPHPKSAPIVNGTMVQQIADIPSEGNWYAIQIMASKEKLKTDNNAFQDYSERIYMFTENGWYKYCVELTNSKSEILNSLAQTRRSFKEAFPISFRNGVKKKFTY